MKKLILIFATAILGLASCQQKTDDKAAIELAKQAAIDSMKMVAQAQEVKQMVIDSMQKATPTTQVTQSAGEGAQSSSAAIWSKWSDRWNVAWLGSCTRGNSGRSSHA